MSQLKPQTLISWVTVQTQLLAVWRQKSGCSKTHWGCDQNQQLCEYFLGKTQQSGTFERRLLSESFDFSKVMKTIRWKCLPWVYLPTSISVALDKCPHTHWPNIFISQLLVVFAFIALSINAPSSVLIWVLGSRKPGIFAANRWNKWLFPWQWVRYFQY